MTSPPSRASATDDGSALPESPSGVAPGVVAERQPGPRRLRSEVLFGNGSEVEIAHGEVVYRLRRTSLGKLILTK